MQQLMDSPPTGGAGRRWLAKDGADRTTGDPLAPILARDRWSGVLTSEEIALCRRHGVPLAYDCAQIGWIPEAWAEAEEYDTREIPAPAPAAEQAPASAEDALREARESLERAFESWKGSQEAPPAGEVAEALRARRHEITERIAETHGVRAADRAHWVLRRTQRRMLGNETDESPAVGASVEDEGLSFRAWTVDDVPVYLDLLKNPRVWEFLPEPYPSPFDEETARTLIEVGAFDFHHEAVAVEHEGVPVGQCLVRFDPEGTEVRAAEVAYWLGEAHWGKGLMSRILPLFTRRCLERHDLDVIYAWIHEDHEASARVARRAGYRRDDFPREEELAEALGRPGFIRYAVFAEDRTG